MRLLIASQIDPGAVERLRRDHDVVLALGASGPELHERLADREVLIFRSGVAVTERLLDAAPALVAVIRAGSGFDNVDLEALEARGVRFHRIPEPGARAVAELAFGLMLCVARKILWADGMWRQGHWVKDRSSGTLLRGKVLGIVGAGSIGAQVGELGAAWGMHPIGCVARPTPDAEARLAQRGVRLAPFPEVLEQADFLSLHVPLSEGTRGLIGAAELARMKPGSFLVNLSRGGVVDESALARVLTAGGPLAGAALDVHAREGEGAPHPLADLPNVVLTPHIGSQAVDTQREIGERVSALVAGLGHPSPPDLQPVRETS